MNRAPLHFRPIRTKRTFEEVSFEIKKMIITGKLKPGDKLPSEIELAHQFGVGRQTIREAHRILELSGFITIKKGFGGGPVIQNTMFNRIESLFYDAFLTKMISRDDLHAARLGIEQVILDNLVKHVDEADLQALEDNIHRAKRNMAAGIHPFKENAEFHVLLAKATKNQILIVMMQSIMAIVAEFFIRILPDINASRGVIETVIHEHEDILEALTKGQNRKAKVLMEKHLKFIRKSIHENEDWHNLRHDLIQQASSR